MGRSEGCSFRIDSLENSQRVFWAIIAREEYSQLIVGSTFAFSFRALFCIRVSAFE
jgi:hypothetical protein